EPGGNIVQVSGDGEFIRDLGPAPILAGGSLFAGNASVVAAPVVLPATEVVSAAGGPVYRQAVTFTATVPGNGPGGSLPSGSVQFRIDGVDYGPALPLSAGSATLTTASLAAGAHSVSAVYTSDRADFASGTTAEPLIQTVDKAPLTVTADD